MVCHGNNLTVQLSWARHGNPQSAHENRRFRGLVGHRRGCQTTWRMRPPFESAAGPKAESRTTRWQVFSGIGAGPELADVLSRRKLV